MPETLQLEEAVELHVAHHVPALLVDWSPRWRDFLESIGPAFSRSEARLAGEAPFGLIPLRIMIPSYVIEAFVVLAVIFLEAKIAELRPYAVPRIASHDVIYFSGDELPRVQDLGGSQAGTAGAAGGQEAYHHTQTIKVARGGSLVSKVVDAPNLKLPASRDSVANLLAIRPDPGPPPAEGLRSQRSAPNLATTIVAPSPDVIRDYTRNGIQMDSVIAPSPNVTRDRPLTAPSLNATLIPPALTVSSDHTLVAPALAPTVVPPAPSVTRDRTSNAPSLSANVVAPSPTVPRDPFRANPQLAANVIPPAPGTVSRQISSAPVQMDASVVPPPVSAPERAGARSSKVSLPAPAAIAPPPSTNINSDMRRLGASVADPARTVVPPPPSQTGNGSLVSTLIGKIFGTQEVVPPPPSVNATGANNGSAPSLAANVVAPAPSVNSGAGGGNPNGNRRGAGASLDSNVVAPPPSVGMAGGTGSRQGSGAAPYLGNPSVVPPPPSLAGPGGGTGKTGGSAGVNGGTLLATNVVPPPPSVGAGSTTSGSGTSRTGMGLGAPSDVGSNTTPPNAAGAGKDAGAIVSSQPGTKVGLPPGLANGSLAMAPTGGDKTGVGGTGGGSGIGRGPGSGAAINGGGPGAAKNGTGHGADPNASGGVSTTTGPGGAGNGTAGNPAIRGVDISGGSGIVTLPSFGSDGSAGDPNPASRSSLNKQHQQEFTVDVVATATSGGAFEPYKNLLHGDKHTSYIYNTTLGTVVMEYADEQASNRSFGGTLTAPVALRSDLPEGLPRARMVVTCTLDASGNVRNLKVLEPGPAIMTAKVVSALHTWKFQPAMKNNQPIEVTAILGFGIDTNDRF